MLRKLTLSLHRVVKVLPQRLITTETASALKQFYFAVHPDLFGKFPRQKLINEESLKKLNSYIDEVGSEGCSGPLNLQFFLKDTTQETTSSGELQYVNITLNTNSVDQAVYQILQSCGLPCQQLKSYQQSNSTHIRLDYDHAFHYETQSRRQKTKPAPKPSPLLTLKHFLANSASLARERLEHLESVQLENTNICNRLRDESGLKEVVLDCGFGCVPIQGFLRNFYHLFNRNKESISDLSGRVLVFGNTTCVNALGHVVLSMEDVPENWLKLLRSLSDYDVLVDEGPIWERRLSKRLGNIQIVHDHELPGMPITDYLQQLKILLLRLKSAELKTSTPDSYLVKPGSFMDLHAAVLSSCDSIQLSPSGQFRIPGICLSDILVEFLLKNKQCSLDKREEYLRNTVEEQEIVQECKDELGLIDLHKDRSVTLVQMIECSTKLLDTFGLELEGLKVKVTHSYHLSEDGNISIPWNWK